MKNNKLILVLLFLAVGFIYYKLFVRIRSNNEENITSETNLPERINTEKIRQPKWFVLNATYDDPFHETNKKEDLGQKLSNNEQLSLPSPKPEKKIKSEVIWPIIKYYGFVRNTDAKQPRALVNIDGAIYKIKVGDQVLDDVLLKACSSSQIVIKYKGLEREFIKTKK